MGDELFSKLPREIILNIFGRLSLRDLFSLTETSTALWHLGGDPLLWRDFPLHVSWINGVHMKEVLDMPRMAALSSIFLSSVEIENIHQVQLDLMASRGLKYISCISCDFSKVQPELFSSFVAKIKTVSLKYMGSKQLYSLQKIQMFKKLSHPSSLKRLELFCMDLTEIPAEIFKKIFPQLEYVNFKGCNLTAEQRQILKLHHISLLGQR